MSSSDAFEKSELEKIKTAISSLESRISNIESKVGKVSRSLPLITISESTSALSDSSIDLEDSNRSFLESSIGEYGLAWLGNLVMLFGITFLTGFLQAQGFPFVSALLGYVCVVVILYLSNRIKKAFPHMGFVLYLNGHILLYYITLRLHYFGEEPLLSNSSISLILLITVLIVQIVLAIRSKSQALFGLALILGLFTAIVSDTTHIMLPIATLISATATYFMFRFNWGKSLVLSIVLVYSTFLLWFLNNPVMGNPYGAISDQPLGVIYIFIVGAVYSFIALAREKDKISEEFAMAIIIINGISFSLLLVFSVLQFFSTNYIGLFFAITLYCLGYAIVLKSFSKWKFTPASYALYGFVAMSIALYGMVGLPNVFLLLAIQSVLVISFALWFRNKIIVIMNALLLISLLAIYLVVSDPIDGVNFSFAIATLLTARILNWKKERLEIQTDILRNVFLITGFFLVLYAFFHWAPKQFITLCWSAAALLYFIMSLLLKNKKYRIMSLGTIIAATFYLLIIDLSQIDIIFRISALLFLAFISIGISIYYSKSKKKT